MAPPPPPPPPPPPICFPFTGNKPRRRLSFSSAPNGVPYTTSSYSGSGSLTPSQLSRHQSYSSGSTLPSKAAARDIDNLTFYTDSEKYDEIPGDVFPTLPSGKSKGKDKPKLVRSNTMTGTKKSKWGYGWGIGKKNKEKEAEAEREMSEKPPSISTGLPMYESPRMMPRALHPRLSVEAILAILTILLEAILAITNNLARSNTRDTQKLGRSNTQNTMQSQSSKNSRSTQESGRSQHTQRTHASTRSGGTVLPVRPNLAGPADSSSTLVGSALERKLNPEESITEKVDTSERLEDLRQRMEKEKDPLQFYIIPTEDAHGSEYVAASDQRRKYMSGFTGSAGQAIVTMDAAYLVTDSRYWLQAQNQLDSNWTLIRAGGPGNPKDWIEWLVVRLQLPFSLGITLTKIFIGTSSDIQLQNRYRRAYDFVRKSHAHQYQTCSAWIELVYPIQNLVDLVWKDKPAKSKHPVFVHPIEFTGEDAASKLQRIRDWIRSQPPDISQYSRTQEPKPSQINIATLITSLDAIAWTLNLRGSDIPFNPLFHAYLFISFDRAVLFLEKSKVNEEVEAYLSSVGVERRDYTDIWAFLRHRDWNSEGKVFLLVLTHFRCTVLPSYVEHMMAIKNKVELEGLRRAYLRDGVCYVRFLGWLEDKLNQGYDVTEWEAAHRLTSSVVKAKHFMGLAYEKYLCFWSKCSFTALCSEKV
ncbi:hypothetical protein D9757_011057 [Collybiopsis confluens]|uniref:Creatinase N-terminal domain-containing protein n=1 Tax=Collybiopsis confluens TaxID=2823264 RepID=A0A8H5GJF5_9AGAR|nr:hypothetical protein D9757_011057 [Collybiopsis confluens]